MCGQHKRCNGVSVAASGCGGDLAAGGSESVLSSPGFPNNYTNNLNCIWTITAAAGHRVSIRFTDLNIEGRLGLVAFSPFFLLFAILILIIITTPRCHHEKVISRVHPVHLMNVAQRQAAADPQIKSTDLGCESACRLLSFASTIAILLLLSLKADTSTHFSFPWKVEG